MRDQIFLTMSCLDHIMVICTLLISIGFGFVMEGTFPPTEDQLASVELSVFQVVLLHLYTLLAIAALLCPFLAMMFVLLIRQELDISVREEMAGLQHHLLRALEKATMEDFDATLEPYEEQAVRDEDELFETSSESEDSEVSSASSDGHRSSASIKGRKSAKASQTYSQKYDRDYVGRVARDEIRIIKLAFPTTTKLFSRAQVFLRMGIISALLLCALLNGINMQWKYPSVPFMWCFYSIPIVVSTCFAIRFLWKHKFRQQLARRGRFRNLATELQRRASTRSLPSDSRRSRSQT